MSGYAIKDFRKSHFYICDNIIVDINHKYIKELKGAPLLLYSIILSKKNNTNYIPSLKKISEASGYGNKTIIKALNKLEELSLIKVKRQTGKKNTIYILPVPELEEKEKEITENTIVAYVAKNYKSFTEETKDLIIEFLSKDIPLTEKLKPIGEQLIKDKRKLKLIKSG